MTTISEGTASALRILRDVPLSKRVEPMRHLFDPSRSRLKYVKSENTDIARTFRKARLLARIQGVTK